MKKKKNPKIKTTNLKDLEKILSGEIEAPKQEFEQEPATPPPPPPPNKPPITMSIIPPAPEPEPAPQAAPRGGKRPPTMEEAGLVIKNLPKRVRRNTLNDDVFYGNEKMDDFSEADIMSRCREICRIWKLAFVKDQMKDALLQVADQSRFNPLVEFFSTLPAWDGIDRIRELAKKIETVEGEDVCTRWFQVWLCGAIRVIIENRHNHVLLLIGEGGKGKSYLTEWLCPLKGFWADTKINPSNKDSTMATTETFIHELGDFSVANFKNGEDLKAFLSREKVKERKAFGRIAVERKAITSYVATSNCILPFVDPENRRFLTLEVKSIDWTYKEIDKYQLWSQAVTQYQEGLWALTKEEIAVKTAQNNERYAHDPIDDLLESKVEIGSETDFLSNASLFEILGSFGLQMDDRTTKRLAICAKKMGLVKGTKKTKGIAERGYFRAKRKEKE